MIQITQTPKKNYHSFYVVVGSSIDEILEELLPRIRSKSQTFYKKHIAEDLKSKGKTIIDEHAGNGIFYDIYYEK